MPSATETKMNLSALQQVDPEINEIVDSAAQVALFQYSTQTSQWTKSDIEGALFVYAHRNPSERGLIILNRHSPKNYKEPITADIEFKMNPPFLIYKTPSGQIFGAWFYVAEECTRVGSRCCRLVNYLKKREKNSSGGQGPAEKTTSILQGLLLPPNPGGSNAEKSVSQTGNNNSNSNSNNNNKNQSNKSNSNNNSNNNAKQNGQTPQGKDIMSLLQRAHIEDKPSKKQPLVQNNNANRKQENLNSTNNNNNSNNQRRFNGGAGGTHFESSPGVPVVHKPVPTKALPPSVEQLFKSAGRKQQNVTQQQQQPQPQQRQQPNNGAQLIQSLAQAATPAGPRSENPLDRLLNMATAASPTSQPHLTVAPAAPPMNDCMASILNKLNESAQKVQREQQQQIQALEVARLSPPNGGAPQTASNGLANALFGALGGGALPPTSTASTITGEKKLTLITPEMLEESLSQSAPLTPPHMQAAPVAAMSRAELRSALVHLLEHDDEFLNKIHLAYLQGASRRKMLSSNYSYESV